QSITKSQITHLPNALVIAERRRELRHGPEHFRELAPLQQLAALAAAPRDLVLRRANRLFGASSRFHREQVAIARRRDEAEAAILLAQLDQDHAFARTGEEIHLVGFAQQAAAFRSGSDEDLLAGDLRDADDFGASRGPGVAAPRPRARLDQAL